MQKKNVLNLIKYHMEKNDDGFRRESQTIAHYFDSIGDTELAQYIMALLFEVNTFMPQVSANDNPFLRPVSPGANILELPVSIKEKIHGIINTTKHDLGINKFLFEGDPGAGKTETVKRIAQTLQKELFLVDFDSLIDSKLGQTSKNIASVFADLGNLPQPQKAIILFDEIDALALDRVNSNDLREMGRVTSSVLKGLDGLAAPITLIATTNLYDQFDKALIRRFDLVVNFNQYSREDLIKGAEAILNELLLKFKSASRNMRLFRKILLKAESIPYPGQLKNMIKTSLAFSDQDDEYDYLQKFYQAINQDSPNLSRKSLKEAGFTVREISILTGVSKSQVARDLAV